MNIFLKYNSLIALALITFFIITPLVSVSAQTADIAPISDISLSQTSTSETISTTLDMESVISITLNTQTTIPSDVIMSTQNSSDLFGGVDTTPQETISADTLTQTQNPAVVPDDGSSSTNTTLTDVPTSDTTNTPNAPSVILDSDTIIPTDTTPILEEKDTTNFTPEESNVLDQTDKEIISEVVTEIPIGDIFPKDKFKFAIHSESIETNREPLWQDRENGDDKNGKKFSINSNKISTPPYVIADTESGVPVISGICGSAYYVILFYKNQTDYDKNPASYAFNKAYPCTNGSYSFLVKDFPESIPKGTYYLLVAEMGETGPWKPMTSLVPIDILY